MTGFESQGRRVTLTDVVAGNTARLPDLERMLPEFFPTCEKFLPLIRQRAAHQPAPDAVQSHQWVVDVDGETAGFYLFDYLPRRGCGLTLFIGVYPEYRPVAFGGYARLAHYLIAESLRQITRDAAQAGEPPPLGLAVEVELPALLNRYRQYNFVDLPVVYYEPMFPQPATHYNTDIDETRIGYEQVAFGLFTDAAREPDLSRECVAHLALAFLQDFYQLPARSFAVQQALATAQALSLLRE
jgi:hypothetical protein